MSPSNHTAAAASSDDKAQSLNRIERLLEEFEANTTSSSPEEEVISPLSYLGICDSLTLKQYGNLKCLEEDNISEEDLLNLSQEEVDRAWEEFDSSWEQSLTTTPPSARPVRSGVRRGRQEPSTSTAITVTVMTKTHDGSGMQALRHLNNYMNTASAA